ncbi:MAG TPA: hypothetical protein ENJ28_03865 [Gammaproteobacteria bacterium]|nr:hypothetical protein [Gammaproteobacteria bacterium]
MATNFTFKINQYLPDYLLNYIKKIEKYLYPVLSDGIFNNLNHLGKFSFPSYSPNGWPIRTLNLDLNDSSLFKRIRIQGVLFDRNNIEVFEPNAGINYKRLEFNKIGKPYLHAVGFIPKGGALAKYTNNAATILPYLKKYCNVDTLLAFGEYEVTFHGERLGFLILGDECESESRGYHIISQYFKSNGKVNEDIEQKILSLCEVYKGFLSRGFIHGSPHPHNFAFDRKVWIKDYEDISHASKLTKSQHIAYLVRDIRYFFMSICYASQWDNKDMIKEVFSLCSMTLLDHTNELDFNDFVIYSNECAYRRTLFDEIFYQENNIEDVEHPIVEFSKSIQKTYLANLI